jgi:hypothetical protein
MADPCVYTLNTEEGRGIIGLHVDDFVIAASPKVMANTKATITSRFKVKDLGPTKYILGIQVLQTPTSISITQSTYMKNILSYIYPCIHPIIH